MVGDEDSRSALSGILGYRASLAELFEAESCNHSGLAGLVRNEALN